MSGQNINLLDCMMMSEAINGHAVFIHIQPWFAQHLINALNYQIA